VIESLPEHLDILVRSELRDREELVWASQPNPRRFMWFSTPIVLFGIPWTAFAIFWMAGAASPMLFGHGEGGANDGPQAGPNIFAICFPLFGVPFVLIGFGMLSSPFWMYRRARRTYYALTDQRAIIWSVGLFGGTEVRSFQAADLGKMVRRDYADGSGDLIFEEAVSRNGDGGSHRPERGFLAIENVREVEALIQRTLLTAKRDSGHFFSKEEP
jgi:hypothetical protein